MRFGKTDISNYKRFSEMSKHEFASMFYLSMSNEELESAWNWIQIQINANRRNTTRKTASGSAENKSQDNVVKSSKRRKRKKTSESVESKPTETEQG